MHNSNIFYGDVAMQLKNFLAENSYSQVFVLVDENTQQFCLPKLGNVNFQIIKIESGEKHKNLQTCEFVWKEFIHNKADRSSLLINLGGGVITDLGGFVASCYKRGIDFIHIPTTLLAMVDASIGGKTGIDFHFEKNMIGLFSEAKVIFIDPIFLETLDARQIKNGKAEMLKHGLIASKEHYQKCLQSFLPSLEEIQESIEIKLHIVASDPKEKGIRKTLNFGHTLGHALETCFLKNGKVILHGEAIVQGMIWAITLSSKLHYLEEQIATTLKQDLVAIYGKISISSTEINEILAHILNDKKNEKAKVQWVILEEIGKAKWNIVCKEEDVSTLLSTV
jgi:3-dehydroquinate synthase